MMATFGERSGAPRVSTGGLEVMRTHISQVCSPPIAEERTLTVLSLQLLGGSLTQL